MSIQRIISTKVTIDSIILPGLGPLGFGTGTSIFLLNRSLKSSWSVFFFKKVHSLFWVYRLKFGSMLTPENIFLGFLFFWETRISKTPVNPVRKKNISLDRNMFWLAQCCLRFKSDKIDKSVKKVKAKIGPFPSQVLRAAALLTQPVLTEFYYVWILI